MPPRGVLVAVSCRSGELQSMAPSEVNAVLRRCASVRVAEIWVALRERKSQEDGSKFLRDRDLPVAALALDHLSEADALALQRMDFSAARHGVSFAWLPDLRIPEEILDRPSVSFEKWLLWHLEPSS